MLTLNFYKIRSGLDIRPLNQEGDDESQARYDQILQTVAQRGEMEYISDKVFIKIEKIPSDLGAYQKTQLPIYILILGIDGDRSSWNADELKLALYTMRLNDHILKANPDAQNWMGGDTNNISCEDAKFDLKTSYKKK